jgi:hypothetical protein
VHQGAWDFTDSESVSVQFSAGDFKDNTEVGQVGATDIINR